MASTRSAGGDIAGALGVTLALLTACGEPAEAPEVEAPSERGTFDGQEAAARSLGYDPYAIGATWFEYDHATHALTPRLEVYVARRGEQVAIFELASYYDARGESGFFTVRGDAWDGAAWSGPVDFVTEVNVKDARTCLALAPLSEVGCGTPDAALILRTSWRTVAEAGIAVKEPALLARAHFSWPEDERTWLTALPEVTLDEVARDAAALTASPPLPNASWDPTASRVGWLHDAPGGAPRADANLHVTANMQLAHWRVTGLDGLSVTIEKRCQSASYTAQQPLPEATQAGTITLDEGAYTGKLVRLCDPQDADAAPAVVATLTDAPAGAWPDTKTFDLIVEQLDGRVSVRPAPGHLLVNWTRRAGAEGFAPPTDMELLWRDYP
jgi:hypothetical protein